MIRDPAKRRRTYMDDFGTPVPERPAGENTGGRERGQMVREAPGDPVCNVTGMARHASAAPGVVSLGDSEKGNKQEAQREGLPADSGSPVSGSENEKPGGDGAGHPVGAAGPMGWSGTRGAVLSDAPADGSANA
jgi:hypothetical protein